MVVVVVQGVSSEVEIKSGDPITVTIDDQYQESCTKDLVWLDYKNLINVIDPGKRILIDDGNLSLVVQEKGQYCSLSGYTGWAKKVSPTIKYLILEAAQTT